MLKALTRINPTICGVGFLLYCLGANLAAIWFLRSGSLTSLVLALVLGCVAALMLSGTPTGKEPAIPVKGALLFVSALTLIILAVLAWMGTAVSLLAPGTSVPFLSGFPLTSLILGLGAGAIGARLFHACHAPINLAQGAA